MDVPKQALSRCPSCLHNFFNIYCYFTCAPNHSQFVYPSKTTPYVDPKTNKTGLQVNMVRHICLYCISICMLLLLLIAFIALFSILQQTHCACM